VNKVWYQNSAACGEGNEETDKTLRGRFNEKRITGWSLGSESF